MSSLLEARHLTKEFSTGSIWPRKKMVALEDFGMTILAEKPTIIAVAGESGSGKTTLARLLLGIIRPTEGEILYQGKSLTKMSGEEWKTFRREVQAMQAQNVLSARVIAALPLGLIVTIRATNPDYLAVFGSAGGQAVLALCLVSVALGYAGMLRASAVRDAGRVLR